MAVPRGEQDALRIGEAARAAELDPRTLRYYEQIGLVRASRRTSAGYRLYSGREVEALRFVRRARALGLSLREAGELLTTWARGERPCRELDAILRRRLDEVEARIRELRALREEMRGILDAPAREVGAREERSPEGVCPRLAGVLLGAAALVLVASGSPEASAAPAGERHAGGDQAQASAAGAAPLDPVAIGRAAGTEARVGPDLVVRIGWSRENVPVRVDGRRLEPAAGLGSWAAFRATEAGALVMGDTVVFEDEITPAFDAALAAGLEITALHNHFVFDRPPVYFMHLAGRGSAEALAAGVKRVWDAIRAVRAEHPQPRDGFPGDPPEPGSLDAERLGTILGAKARRRGDVVKVSFPREGRARDLAVGGSMGLTTWAAFSGSDARASVDGDFIMTAAEVQPVVRALRASAIHVVALHNHMLEEEPRFFFLHYWGKGAAADLAKGIARAREAQRSATPRSP